MNTWSPLWSKIVDSSIWSEDDSTCKVFITILALKDSDHICRYSAFQLARRCNKSEADVLKALDILLSPDIKRLEPQPNEGRRIEKVEDGWLVLNGKQYQEMVQEEMRKNRLRKAQAAFRERQKLGGNAVTPPNQTEAGHSGFIDTADQYDDQFGQEESEAVKQSRIKRVKEKIARKEAITDEVRSKHNPKYSKQAH